MIGTSRYAGDCASKAEQFAAYNGSNLKFCNNDLTHFPIRYSCCTSCSESARV